MNGDKLGFNLNFIVWEVDRHGGRRSVCLKNGGGLVWVWKGDMSPPMYKCDVILSSFNR